VDEGDAGPRRVLDGQRLVLDAIDDDVPEDGALMPPRIFMREDFAGTVLADQTDDLSAGDGQADAVERGDARDRSWSRHGVPEEFAHQALVRVQEELASHGMEDRPEGRPSVHDLTSQAVP
jgi:hypothetical protein